MIISLSQQALPTLLWPGGWKELNLGKVNLGREIMCCDLIRTELIAVDKENITKRNWFIDPRLKKKEKNHWPAEDSLGADPFKGFNGQWLQAIISESQTFVTVNNSQDGPTKSFINRTEGNCSEWGCFWKIKGFLIFYFSFYPSDVTALKHIIVWNCPCVWPELKSLLTTPDPEPCSRKTAEAKWEERQSSR